MRSMNLGAKIVLIVMVYFIGGKIRLLMVQKKIKGPFISVSCGFMKLS